MHHIDYSSTLDGVSFQLKAQAYAGYLIFTRGLAPGTISSSLSGVCAILTQYGTIKDRTEWYSPALTNIMASHDAVLSRCMYADDGRIHEDFRIETFRAMIIDMLHYARSTAPYSAIADELTGIVAMSCGLSLRPVEGAITSAASVSSLAAPGAADAPNANGLPARKAFFSQHCFLVLGSRNDAAYVCVTELAKPEIAWNPRGLPIIGIQMRAKIKNDQKGQRGSRSLGCNPNYPLDNFCLVRTVVAVLKRFPPASGQPVWSGLPFAAEEKGKYYYHQLAGLCRDYAIDRGLDFRRLNPHALRLYGITQLTACNATDRDAANQGAWVHPGDKAKGMLVYYRNHFWNHGHILAAHLHADMIPLAHLEKYRVGESVAMSLSQRDKIRRRIAVMGSLASNT